MQVHTHMYTYMWPYVRMYTHTQTLATDTQRKSGAQCKVIRALRCCPGKGSTHLSRHLICYEKKTCLPRLWLPVSPSGLVCICSHHSDALPKLCAQQTSLLYRVFRSRYFTDATEVGEDRHHPPALPYRRLQLPMNPSIPCCPQPLLLLLPPPPPPTSFSFFLSRML